MKEKRLVFKWKQTCDMRWECPYRNNPLCESHSTTSGLYLEDRELDYPMVVEEVPYEKGGGFEVYCTYYDPVVARKCRKREKRWEE